MNRDIYENISPLDARYYTGNRKLVDALSRYISERSLITYEAVVEAALVTAMENHGLVRRGASAQMKKACRSITPEEVYEEEEKTRHNIRALVNVMQRHVDPDVGSMIHLSATSEDITGTAQALRIRDVLFKVVVPVCLDLLEVFADIAGREADTVQIGRTHGQHAVPVTVGYLFAGYADRFGGRVERIAAAAKELRGKMSGAVGAYNASALLVGDPRAFEIDALRVLKIEPAEFSSQIVEPEYLLDLIHAIVSGFGILAQVGDDLRNLQRTEIGEMGETFEKGQVGSSTMPHKRNPWNFEFVPRMVTRYLDQISEHQRDLTNSASGRFVVEIITGFTLAANRLLAQLRKLSIDRENLRRNLQSTKGMFLAEPLYILLASKGVGNAHELVKGATLAAQREGRSFFDVVREEGDFRAVTDTETWTALTEDPARYLGKARERSIALSSLWTSRLNAMRTECAEYKDVFDD
jgi:adenylosuccinate lyase